MTNTNDLLTSPTPRSKWRKDKFWAFLLLSLNRAFNKDPLPPQGFKFVHKINPRKWWWYQHYGFHPQTYGFQTSQEANEHDFHQDSPEKDNDDQLSDIASVGNRPGMAEQHPSFSNERAWDDVDIDHMDEVQSSSATSTPCPAPDSFGGGYTPHFGWESGFEDDSSINDNDNTRQSSAEKSDVSAALSAMPPTSSPSPPPTTIRRYTSIPSYQPCLPLISDDLESRSGDGQHRPLRFSFQHGFHHCSNTGARGDGDDDMECSCTLEPSPHDGCSCSTM
ncbi:hypothetical protein M438DRAFT_359523 [Aureobasidium pullulans EXF-150]|uniref:Uncharacterized protein n=1 Tax=Aureobasidium pullulans EXF-150 TaxID=1043002 RepID=A0A074X2G6_AURPU|nr:uncharacterized protein M438DRAFT_359523 [Aureobasidium pullulans EXF-150]KEQ79660.1 hypothetical protein M438DRAFT_359523 [Aureobasidium pullulans EXF-150]